MAARRLRSPWVRIVTVYGVMAATLIGLAASRTVPDLGSAGHQAIVVAVAIGLVVGAWLDSRLLLGHTVADRDDSRFRLARLLMAVASCLVGGGLIVGAAIVGGTDGWTFAGLLVLLFGSWHVLMELRLALRHAESGLPVAVGLFAAAAACLACGVLLFTHSTTAAWILLIVGLALVVVAWEVASGVALARAPGWLRIPAVLIGGGAGALIALAILLYLHAAPPWWTVGLAVLVLVFALFVTSDTVVDGLVVVVAVALVWALAPRSVSEPAVMKPASGANVVAMFGDSIPSGEGAQRFIAGTNTLGANTCRRAASAWSVLLVSDPNRPSGVPDRLVSLACSGATTSNITTVSQHDNEPLHYPGKGLAVPGFPKGLPQLRGYDWSWQHLPAAQPFVPKIVFVTIGANDAGFGTIGQTCLGPGDCSQIGQLFLDRLDQVSRDDIQPAYDAIREEFGGRAAIVVSPYAVPIAPTACSSSPLTANEAKFLYHYTLEMDRMLQRDAAAEGFYYVNDMPLAFTGRQICAPHAEDKPLDVNFVTTNPVRGTVEQALSPLNWLHDSLHPNPRGHRRMEAVIASFLQSQGGLPAPSPQTVPANQPPPFAAASIESIMGPGFRHCQMTDTRLRPDSCADTVSAWNNLHRQATLASISLPLLLLVASCWFIWLGVLSRRRGRNHPSTTDPDPNGDST
jgi:hypothetical protein